MIWQRPSGVCILPGMATYPTEPALHSHHGARSWSSYWRDDSGKLHVKRLGRERLINRRTAHAIWKQWIQNEWEPYDSIKNPGGTAADYTCTRLAAQYLLYARRTFLKNGRRTSHVEQIRYAMRALRDCKGQSVAEKMESPDLARIRDWMIVGEKTVKGVHTFYKRSITTVNGRLLLIKEAFAWAREKGRVPRAVVLDLLAVKPLAPGRSDAKDAQDIQPIALAVVEATLPACSSVVAGMIQVNLYAGARPGEVCIMRPCDLEMCTPDCWLYTPESHKMQHKGIVRRIALGPKAIAVIRPFLERQLNVQGYLFSPREARAELYRRRSDHYKRAKDLKINGYDGAGSIPACALPSVMEDATLARPRPDGDSPARRLPGSTPGVSTFNPRHGGDRYSEQSYRKAIHHACRKAGIAPWGPNQLRHTHATEVRRVFGLAGLTDTGLEAAKETLGHADTRTSEIYANESMDRAMEIARRVG